MPLVIWPTASRVVQFGRFLSRVSPWVVVRKSGYARRCVNGSQTNRYAPNSWSTLPPVADQPTARVG